MFLRLLVIDKNPFSYLPMITPMTGKRQLEFGRDVVEGIGNAFTQRGDGGDDHDRDQSGDQRVFNRGDSALVHFEFSHFEGDGGAYVVNEHEASLPKLSRIGSGIMTQKNYLSMTLFYYFDCEIYTWLV